MYGFDISDRRHVYYFQAVQLAIGGFGTCLPTILCIYLVLILYVCHCVIIGNCYSGTTIYQGILVSEIQSLII